MQRILQQHVGRSEFIYDAEIAGLTPKIGEPPTNDGFILLFFGHSESLLRTMWQSPTSVDDPREGLF
jgi:hypothetical protein